MTTQFNKYYAGIGSRETPEHLVPAIRKIATYLYEQGYTLRSGGAPGADKFFEAAITDKTRKEIYLPWLYFHRSTSPLAVVSDEAIEFSLKYHPAPERLTLPMKKLMGRNAYQVLGPDLKTPVDFIVCWTKDGGASGGTGQALRIAAAYNIKIFNLYNGDKFEEWYEANNFDLM